VLKQLDVSRDELEEVKAVEVGNIFDFGVRKSKDLGLFYKNDAGEEIPVISVLRYRHHSSHGYHC